MTSNKTEVQKLKKWADDLDHAVDRRFDRLKSQKQIDREDNREAFFHMLEDVTGVVAILGMALALMYLPKWLPVVAAWWQG